MDKNMINSTLEVTVQGSGKTAFDAHQEILKGISFWEGKGYEIKTGSTIKPLSVSNSQTTLYITMVKK